MAAPSNIRSAIMDPLLNFKFLVSWTDSSGNFTVVAGVSKVGPLSRKVETVKYREGAAPTAVRILPGQVAYNEIKLERGIIIDIAFEAWANKVWNYGNSAALGQNVSLKDFRKDLKIDLCNQAGQIMNSYYAFNCWPSEYSALPELDSNAGATIAVETMTLQTEAWARDDSLTAPAYPDGYAQYDAPTSPILTGVKAPT